MRKYLLKVLLLRPIRIFYESRDFLRDLGVKHRQALYVLGHSIHEKMTNNININEKNYFFFISLLFLLFYFYYYYYYYYFHDCYYCCSYNYYVMVARKN